MKVITLLNEKGGVGKTTLASTLASQLAILGKRVVLIDADPQGTASRAFGLPNEPRFHDLMVRGQSWAKTLVEVSPGHIVVPDALGDFEKAGGALMVAVGDAETRSITEHVRDGSRLLKRIQQLEGDGIDFVVIDTSPTPSQLNSMVHLASDGILYPTQLERWSLEGLLNSLTIREEISGYRQSLGYASCEIYGIIPNMTNISTIEHSENYKWLQEQFTSLVYRPIPRRIIWAETATLQKSIFAYAPESECAKDGVRLVKQLFGVLQNVKE